MKCWIKIDGQLIAVETQIKTSGFNIAQWIEAKAKVLKKEGLEITAKDGVISFPTSNGILRVGKNESTTFDDALNACVDFAESKNVKNIRPNWLVKKALVTAVAANIAPVIVPVTEEIKSNASRESSTYGVEINVHDDYTSGSDAETDKVAELRKTPSLTNNTSHSYRQVASSLKKQIEEKNKIGEAVGVPNQNAIDLAVAQELLNQHGGTVRTVSFLMPELKNNKSFYNHQPVDHDCYRAADIQNVKKQVDAYIALGDRDLDSESNLKALIVELRVDFVKNNATQSLNHLNPISTSLQEHIKSFDSKLFTAAFDAAKAKSKTNSEKTTIIAAIRRRISNLLS